MDPIAALATAVVAFLAPYFAEGATAAAKKAGEAVVAALERRFQSKSAAQEALSDVKKTPQDQDAQATLRQQLKKAMTEDPDFHAELARLLQDAEVESSTATYQADLKGSGAIAQGEGAVAAGARGVAIGGSVSGSTIVTGNSNTVEQPEKDRRR